MRHSATLLVCLLACAAVSPAGTSAQVTEGSRPAGPWALTTDGGTAVRALFVARSNGEDCLWSTDGTPQGTRRLISPTGCLDASAPVIHDGLAYFPVRESADRWSLWRSDGTTSGTWSLTGEPSGIPSHVVSPVPAPATGRVVFPAHTPDHGSEPWVSDGGPGDARLLADLTPGAESSVLYGFREVGSRVLFFRIDGGTPELWSSDGTELGTERIARLEAPLSSLGEPLLPGLLFPVRDGAVFFLLADVCEGQLWFTDGTASGTGPIRSFAGGRCPMGYRTNGLAVSGFPNDVFFLATDGSRGDELWRTDGTSGGTFAVTHFEPERPFPIQDPTGWSPAGLGGRIYFAAEGHPSSEYTGYELWSADGSPGSQEFVADLCPGVGIGPFTPCDSSPEELVTAGDRLVVRDGFETLWISDGTEEGTRLVTCPGGCGSDVKPPAIFGGSLLFAHRTFGSGEYLVKAGLADGRGIELARFRSTRDPIVVLGNRAVFFADDGRHGLEPWVTDGTPAGTRLLVDVETAPVPEALYPPVGLTVQRLGGDRVRLTWKDRTEGEGGFSVQRRDPGATGFTWEGSTGPNATRYETTIVSGGRTRFRVWSWRPTASGSQFSWMAETSIVVGGVCEPDETHLCLGDGRFRVSVRWRNQHATGAAAESGVGRVFPAGDESDDSGYFWFFSPGNVELAVKVLDGTPSNDHFWLFHGGLSDVEYWIDVEETVDSRPGATRTYHKPAGHVCGGLDKEAFPEIVASTGLRANSTAFPIDVRDSGSLAGTSEGICVPDAETLCLLGGRIAARVRWADHRGAGVGHPLPQSDGAGFFWFFRPGNVELIVKALDGLPVNGKIWIFYGALSDLGYKLEVTDLVRSETRVYENPPGTICGRGDTRAF